MTLIVCKTEELVVILMKGKMHISECDENVFFFITYLFYINNNCEHIATAKEVSKMTIVAIVVCICVRYAVAALTFRSVNVQHYAIFHAHRQ